MAAPLVFVVDDDPSVRRALKRMLAVEGYSVEAFSSAEEFLCRDRDLSFPGCLILCRAIGMFRTIVIVID